MKTTVEIGDPLAERARRAARESGRTLRALVEEGLRRVLDDPAPEGWTLPDLSVGEAGGRNPLDELSWQDLRAEIYGG